jgi:hypothetical protein
LFGERKKAALPGRLRFSSLGRGEIPLFAQCAHRGLWDNQVFDFMDKCAFGNDRIVMIHTTAAG